jgi:hypothetical protein
MMDPQQTLQALENAVNCGRYNEAVECLDDYYQWRLKGGFAPKMRDVSGDQFASTCADQLADSLAKFS